VFSGLLADAPDRLLPCLARSSLSLDMRAATARAVGGMLADAAAASAALPLALRDPEADPMRLLDALLVLPRLRTPRLPARMEAEAFAIPASTSCGD
jgi:hypothetical protein